MTTAALVEQSEIGKLGGKGNKPTYFLSSGGRLIVMTLKMEIYVTES